MAIEGLNEWEKQKKRGLMSDASFHLDPKKTNDPAEKRVEEKGTPGALLELVDELPSNTDPEVVRQMKLIINKMLN